MITNSDELLNINLVINDLFGVIWYPLLYLVNTPLSSAVVPSDLKTTKALQYQEFSIV